MNIASKGGLIGALIGGMLGFTRTGCVVTGDALSVGVGVPIVGGFGVYAANVLLNALIGYLIGSIVARRRATR